MIYNIYNQIDSLHLSYAKKTLTNHLAKRIKIINHIIDKSHIIKMVTTSKNSINVFVHSSKINIMMSNMHIIKKRKEKRKKSLQ